MKQLLRQRPDSVLRERKRLGMDQTTEGLQSDYISYDPSGVFAKYAFWALSAGLATMMFVVTTTAKRWT